MLSSYGFARDKVPLGYDPKDLSGCIDDVHTTDTFRVQKCSDVSDCRLGCYGDDIGRHDVSSNQHDSLLICLKTAGNACAIRNKPAGLQGLFSTSSKPDNHARKPDARGMLSRQTSRTG